MAELTDRDRETMYKIFGDRDHWMINPKIWDKVAIALAAAREEGQLAEREKWIALAGPYWRTGREISPLALLVTARREAIEDFRRRLDLRINNLLNETWPDHDDSIVGINQAWAVADALFEEMK